ncbi:MAG TPA: hypothetical protein VGF99_13045, partial [Myxococcota bacterium]
MRRVLTAGLLLSALGGVSLGSAYALAQGGPEPSSAATTVTEDVEAVAPSQYAADADDTISRMRGALQKGLDQVKEARAEKDSVRLLCVNEPVTAM